MRLRILFSVLMLLNLGHNSTAAPQPVFPYPPVEQGLQTASEKHHRFRLKHQRPSDILAPLQHLFPEATFIAHDVGRYLLVRGPGDAIQRVRRYVWSLDRAQDQVHFQVDILEVGDQHHGSVDALFREFASGLAFTYDRQTERIIVPATLHGQINYLQSSGNVSLLAKPSILVLDQGTAYIEIGDKVPYVTTVASGETRSEQVHYLDSGIRLRIRPRISSRNYIHTEIEATYSAVKHWRKIGTASYPHLSKRHSTTQVRLRDGQALIMAGMMDEQEKRTRSGVPILMDIPFIGSLFSGSVIERQKSDLVFIIRPRIIRHSHLGELGLVSEKALE